MSSQPSTPAADAGLLESLRYPFDVATILRKRRALRRILGQRGGKTPVRVALLGGATTSEVRDLLEIFLLDAGLAPEFYESDYNKFYEDAVLGNPQLTAFRPQVAVILTTSRNVQEWPRPFEPASAVEARVEAEVGRLRAAWTRLHEAFGCMVLQDNFDLPAERPLGPVDGTVAYGRTQLVSRLNAELARAARETPWLVIHDLHWLAASLGFERWHDKAYWYHYKLPFSQEAAVHVAASLARAVGALFGKTKKCLVLDLDNTLWGGVIGDDGLGGIKLGKDDPLGEAYVDFQEYCLALKQRGVLLAVCSKNEVENARAGLGHPDSRLKVEDFAAFEASWDPKPEALRRIAAALNIGLDSLVFVDDNPAERALVAAQLPEVSVPDVGSDVSRFAEIVERSGYFDTVSLSADDAARSVYYAENAKRDAAASTFATYSDYLRSLEMVAEIAPFNDKYLPRIAQLTNKTNQWNLTTRRYTPAEMEAMARDPAWVTLYGRLSDKFGDNGLVSVLCARQEGGELHVDLWLMSCRVLKRDLELAMLDELLAEARRRSVRLVVGAYLRTAKNAMVADHYAKMGFRLVEGTVDGDRSVWAFEMPAQLERRNTTLKELSHG